MRHSLLAPLVLLAGCQVISGPPPQLATAEVASDFGTYSIQRVGLMPFDGAGIERDRALVLQDAFLGEFGRTTPYELVPLTPVDLAEIQGSDARRLGWYRPETILSVADRYRLDAILFGTVLMQQLHPPQSLSVQVDLVSAETGAVIWTAKVHLDARDPDVRRGLEAYFGRKAGKTSGEDSWEVALLAPARFARFAAWQVATLL